MNNLVIDLKNSSSVLIRFHILIKQIVIFSQETNFLDRKKKKLNIRKIYFQNKKIFEYIK